MALKFDNLFNAGGLWRQWICIFGLIMLSWLVFFINWVYRGVLIKVIRLVSKMQILIRVCSICTCILTLFMSFLWVVDFLLERIMLITILFMLMLIHIIIFLALISVFMTFIIVMLLVLASIILLKLSVIWLLLLSLKNIPLIFLFIHYTLLGLYLIFGFWLVWLLSDVGDDYFSSSLFVKHSLVKVLLAFMDYQGSTALSRIVISIYWSVFRLHVSHSLWRLKFRCL